MKTHHMPTRSLRVAIAALAFSAVAQAATIGYWRFEDSPGFLSDSSANANTLTNNSSVSQVASPFDNPVPQNGFANLDAASFSGSNYFSTAYQSSFNVGSAFTIEAYIRADDVSGTRVIAGQYDSEGATSGQRSWFFGVNSGQLRLSLSSGSENIATNSAFASALTTGTHYYVAAAYDEGAVTFYLQDLSGNSLLSNTQTNSLTSVNNVTSDFTIGAVINASSTGGTTQAFFGGTIDEVRFSNTTLSQSELLVIPEPSSIMLVVTAALAGLIVFRRRR